MPLIAALCLLRAILESVDCKLPIAAPASKAACGLDARTLGLFFSASTPGLLFGAIPAGRLSDRLGSAQVLAWSVADFGTGVAVGGCHSESRI